MRLTNPEDLRRGKIAAAAIIAGIISSILIVHCVGTASKGARETRAFLAASPAKTEVK